MEVTRLRSALEAEFAVPVARETLVKRAGAVELEGVAAKSVTLAAVFELTDERTVPSSQAVSEPLVGSVPEGFGGRE